MAITHLKTATKTPETETDTARAVVTEMLAAIEAGGEQAVKDYALKLDKWDGPIVLDQAAIAERIRDVPQSVKDDISFAAGQVRRFAEALDPALGEMARATAADCPHYRWLGGQPHEATRRRIQRAHLLVHPSRMEGGAHVIMEAALCGTPVLASADDVFTNHIHSDDLARACVAALWKGRPQRVYHVSDDTELKMGDYFDLAADLYQLPRPPRVGRNPRSGASVAIPEKRVPHFKPGKALREAVDQRTDEMQSQTKT